MLSHNNQQEQFRENAPKKQHYTIKKLSIGVASVLLGVSFANSVSADTTDNANTDSNAGSGTAEQTDHNLVLDSTSTSTLKQATAANQESGAAATVSNPAGDIQTSAANDYEAAVQSAVANTNSSSVASQATSTPVNDFDKNTGVASALETTSANLNTAELVKPASLLNNLVQVNNDTAIQDINDVTPNWNLGPSFNRTIFNFIPDTQTVYSADKDTTNGNIFTYSTDIADPGKTLYFWMNGQLVAQISGDASTGGATGTGNIKQTLHAAFTPEESFNDTLDGKTFFIDRYSTTVGAYQYTKSIITSGDAKVYGISGDVKNTSSNFVWLNRQTGEVDTRMNYSYKTHFVDPAASVNNKTKQTIWYVSKLFGM